MSSSSGFAAGGGGGKPRPLTSKLDSEKVAELPRESSGSDHVAAATAHSHQPGDHTARRLKSRHIQLIGIGGTIGTALYVSIGRGLLSGGPASLFLAFSLW